MQKGIYPVCLSVCLYNRNTFSKVLNFIKIVLYGLEICSFNTVQLMKDWLKNYSTHNFFLVKTRHLHHPQCILITDSLAKNSGVQRTRNPSAAFAIWLPVDSDSASGGKPHYSWATAGGGEFSFPTSLSACRSLFTIRLFTVWCENGVGVERPLRFVSFFLTCCIQPNWLKWHHLRKFIWLHTAPSGGLNFFFIYRVVFLKTFKQSLMCSECSFP